MKTKSVVRVLLGVILAAAIGIAWQGIAHANCGNGGDNGNGCSGNTGPQGPAGPQGPQGTPGTNGSNGANGTNGANGANGTSGKDGKDGKDASTGFVGTSLVGDFAVRLYDGKYLQLQAFDLYTFGSTPGSDVFGQGQNTMIGARVVIKLGSSYEEREIEKLRAELARVHNLLGE